MCFGVRDAIALAFAQSQQQPLTILGELAHNRSVVAALSARGVRTVNDAAAVGTAAVMITAHGASEQALGRLRSRGLHVLEATCPLVHYAHRALRSLVTAGYHPVIVGQRDHVEVRGLTEDLAAYDVVLSEAEIARLAERPRYGVVAQTTQPIDRVRGLVQALERRFPAAEVRFADTVCLPTKQRQAAAIALASRSDVVVVVGGANSNNTRELAATCRQWCGRVHHVQGAAELEPNWFDGARIAGLTAGTSTPDPVIDEVESRLREFAAAADRGSAPELGPRPALAVAEECLAGQSQAG